MTPHDLIDDLKSRINPAYAAHDAEYNSGCCSKDQEADDAAVGINTHQSMDKMSDIPNVLAERETCARMLELSNSELCLIAGEMTAQELRTVKAVLAQRANAIRMRTNTQKNTIQNY